MPSEGEIFNRGHGLAVLRATVNTQPCLAVIRAAAVVVTLTRRHYQVRGHETGYGHSGVEEYTGRKLRQPKSGKCANSLVVPFCVLL